MIRTIFGLAELCESNENVSSAALCIRMIADCQSDNGKQTRSQTHRLVLSSYPNGPKCNNGGASEFSMRLRQNAAQVLNISNLAYTLDHFWNCTL